MANKTHEIGVYVEDIPMKLSDKCRPLDLSAYIDEQTVIPDLFDQHYKFGAEVYALEVSELRDKQKRKQMSESMAKMDLKSENKLKSNESNFKPELSQTDRHRDGMKSRTINSIHLNPGEILKPLPTIKGTTRISDNYYNISDNTIDPNVNIKRKIVKDFESDTSSPFDFVELQTIDDMQELNDVFQAFQSKSIQTKNTINENNSENNANISQNSDNCLNQTNCEQNLSSVRNLNGISLLGAYGYQIAEDSIGTTHSAQTSNASNWLPNNYHNNSTDITSECMKYNSITANHLSDSLSSQSNLRSSKSASDLPTLFKSDDSSALIRRQRSHTPPCASSKTKTKKYINEKQTLVLNDPFEELSQYSKDFVISISSMGFDRSRVARAVKHIGNDHKKVIDFLLQVQSLEECQYDCCESEIALHMNNYQILDAKKFLESLRQLSEVGFDKREIIKALVNCNNDRDKALDILLNTE